MFENTVTNAKFLYSAFYDFDNRQMMELLEEAGCPLKIERGERVFPVSDHSSDIIAALQRILRKNQVEISLRTKVEMLLTEEIPQESTAPFCDRDLKGGSKDGGKLVEKRVRGVRLADGTQICAEAVILATGGLSYPTTGSTGDGMHMAEAAGHMIKKCLPALVPFETADQTGVILELDLKPALSEEQLDKRILRDFEENRNRQFKNALGGLFPVKLVPVMILLSGIAPEKKVHEITKEERKKLVYQIKHLSLHITGTRGFAEAVITQGGVSVKEVNPSTMESKKIKGLYFAGELLDLDALTGGFNLQIAWSTGHLAGSSIS